MENKNANLVILCENQTFQSQNKINPLVPLTNFDRASVSKQTISRIMKWKNIISIKHMYDLKLQRKDEKKSIEGKFPLTQ